MTVTEMSLTAAIASAIAAVTSAVVAFIAIRISSTGLHSDVHPVLRLNYEFGDQKLKFKNDGKGPALNIRLQHTQVHYIDMRAIVRYTIATDDVRTLYTGEEEEFEVRPDKAVSQDDLSLVLKDLNLFRFIEGIGKHKVVGILFDDIYGKSYLAKFRFIEIKDRKYKTDLVSVRSHGIVRKLLDRSSSTSFRLTKKFREWDYILNKQDNDK